MRSAPPATSCGAEDLVDRRRARRAPVASARAARRRHRRHRRRRPARRADGGRGCSACMRPMRPQPRTANLTIVMLLARDRLARSVGGGRRSRRAARGALPGLRSGSRRSRPCAAIAVSSSISPRIQARAGAPKIVRPIAKPLQTGWRAASAKLASSSACGRVQAQEQHAAAVRIVALDRRGDRAPRRPGSPGSGSFHQSGQTPSS